MPLGSRKEFNPSKYIPVLAATTFLVGSTSLFFVFPCPWLSQTFTPVVPVYNVIIFLFVLANFCKATFMDPGIYPRADEDEDKDEDLRAPLFKNVEIRGIQVRMKWCSTCRFYRPPRCSHCSVCDNCVEEFDHHCPWVNNCIGRRNYRYFFLFLISLTTHIVGIFFFALVYLLHHLDRISSVHSAVTVAVMCVAGLFFIPVAGLTAFHLVLVARGRTTNEQVTGKFRGGVNPFTQGCWRNTSYMLCSSQSPRYLSQEKREYPIPLETPFVRPAISDAEVTVKLMDNGVQTRLERNRLRCSLTIMESQSADAEPPPPPKPNLARFSGLRTHLTLATGEGSSLIHHSDNPPTPTMYKFRPAYVDVGQNHFELRHPYSESGRGADSTQRTALAGREGGGSPHVTPSTDSWAQRLWSGSQEGVWSRGDHLRDLGVRGWRRQGLTPIPASPPRPPTLLIHSPSTHTLPPPPITPSLPPSLLVPSLCCHWDPESVQWWGGGRAALCSWGGARTAPHPSTPAGER
ncbi:palmitoyltransferase ZDHHC5-like isoform X3 [Narcine bancroftii]|uniref:palmitoyltransferase ZDHHC5-like isoform X3 n=1 Tax=Narcine bancroftii TaxID=1343680 RepID=UPI003831F3E0